MTFSLGLPVLYFVCSFSFFLSFWVDKFMFIHFYKTPPQHTAEMITKVVKLIRWSVVLHFVLGFFML